MAEPLGMLLAMMQPSPSVEEEFHDWYDTEHIPERAGIEGFLCARRYVCIEGFPRYVAVYDLKHHGVLKEPGYVALSGKKFSPWSKRILPRVHGQFRAEGPQIYPGQSEYGSKGTAAHMVLLRFRGIKDEQGKDIVEGLKRVYEGRDDVLQLRVWRSNYHDDLCYMAMVEGHISLGIDNVDLSPLGTMRKHVDLHNLYIPYWRRGELAGVFS
jgi:hypothetical protein